MKLYAHAHKQHLGRAKTFLALDAIHREQGPITQVFCDGRWSFGELVRLWGEKHSLPVFEIGWRTMRYPNSGTVTKQRIDTFLRFAKPDIVAIFLSPRLSGAAQLSQGHLLKRCADPEWFTGELVKIGG